MSVTVVSCVYGHGDHGRFVPQWAAAITALNHPPDAVIVAGDGTYSLPAFVRALISTCQWRHPQAFYLQQAIMAAETEWAWICDIDDSVMVDGLDGIEDVAADVWQMGFVRSDGETYVPPQLTAAEVLDSDRNLFTGASAIRTDAFRECGGFHDVALQDWALWRRMARRGMTFESSGRAHYNYLRHPATRGAVELTASARPTHLAEMESLA